MIVLFVVLKHSWEKLIFYFFSIVYGMTAGIFELHFHIRKNSISIFHFHITFQEIHTSRQWAFVFIFNRQVLRKQKFEEKRDSLLFWSLKWPQTPVWENPIKLVFRIQLPSWSKIWLYLDLGVLHVHTRGIFSSNIGIRQGQTPK